MTSKISFSKLVCDELRKQSWLTILQLVTFTLVFPFRIMMILATRVSENVKYNMDWDLTEVFCGYVGFGSWENTFTALAAGILCALIVFGYLHSAAKLDFLHSLPVKREQLFAVKYLSGFLSFAIAYGCSQVLTLIVGLGYGAADAVAVLELLAAFILQLLHFLGSFSCTILAVMLTGKFLTSICAVGVFGLYLPMIILLEAGMKEVFLGNLLWSSDTGLRRWLYYTSPWAFGMFHSEAMMSAKKGMTGMWPSMGTVCQLIAMAAVLTAVSVLLYRIRKTEAAGSALAFKKTEGLIKLMLTVPIALITAIVSHEMLENFVWEILFILIFGTLGCLIMELIYRWDIRQVFSKKRHILITFVAATAILCIFRFDLTGQNTYLPDKEDVEYMAVKDNYLYFYYNLGDEDQPRWSAGADTDILDYLETENWEPIYAVAENGVINTGMDYQEEMYYVSLKFHLKNGKDVYRNYWVDADVYLSCMDQILADEEYRERYFPILGREGANGSYGADVYLPKSWLYPETTVSEYEDDTLYIEIPADRLSELVEAYQEDLRSAKYSEMMWSAGNISIGFRGRACEQYYFNADFVNTLELLKEIQGV